MRTFSLLLIALFVGSFTFAQDEPGPVISFDRELHDYGTILTDNVPEGKLTFFVYNTGTEPLVLSNVRACCGTRVNDYTKEPVAPADTGFVEVEFRIVPRPHRIRRTVTIQSNAVNRQTAILRIQGEVTEPESTEILQED
ncbi:MAG: DUF1573 domain-containing protein [Marinilabiliales bacterium]|nr:MAG: DUF1573 domain-containing protein [Marinilabiliales bacterium]